MMTKKMGPAMVERFVDAQMQLADKDGSGSIDFDEFLAVYNKLVSQQVCNIITKRINSRHSKKDKIRTFIYFICSEVATRKAKAAAATESGQGIS